MQEVPDAKRVEALAQQRRQHDEVVVVNPHHVVVWVDELDDAVYEALVRGDVRLPSASVEPASTLGRQRHEVVHGGPQYALAESLVEEVFGFAGYEYGNAPEPPVNFLRHDVLFVLRNVDVELSDEEHAKLSSSVLLFEHAEFDLSDERVFVPFEYPP